MELLKGQAAAVGGSLAVWVADIVAQATSAAGVYETGATANFSVGCYMPGCPIPYGSAGSVSAAIGYTNAGDTNGQVTSAITSSASSGSGDAGITSGLTVSGLAVNLDVFIADTTDAITKSLVAGGAYTGGLVVIGWIAAANGATTPIRWAQTNITDCP